MWSEEQDAFTNAQAMPLFLPESSRAGSHSQAKSLPTPVGNPLQSLRANKWTGRQLQTDQRRNPSGRGEVPGPRNPWRTPIRTSQHQSPEWCVIGATAELGLRELVCRCEPMLEPPRLRVGRGRHPDPQNPADFCERNRRILRVPLCGGLVEIRLTCCGANVGDVG